MEEGSEESWLKCSHNAKALSLDRTFIQQDIRLEKDGIPLFFYATNGYSIIWAKSIIFN
jgi:hypothetical protein